MRLPLIALIALIALSALPTMAEKLKAPVPALDPNVPKELLEQRRAISPDKERPKFLQNDGDEWTAEVEKAARNAEGNKVRTTEQSVLDQPTKKQSWTLSPASPHPNDPHGSNNLPMGSNTRHHPDSPNNLSSWWAPPQLFDSARHQPQLAGWNRHPGNWQTNQAPSNLQPRPKHPTNKQILFHAAFELEKIAHQLEMRDLADAADSLHQAASDLRSKARESKPKSDPGPVPHEH